MIGILQACWSWASSHHIWFYAVENKYVPDLDSTASHLASNRTLLVQMLASLKDMATRLKDLKAKVSQHLSITRTPHSLVVTQKLTQTVGWKIQKGNETQWGQTETGPLTHTTQTPPLPLTLLQFSLAHLRLFALFRQAGLVQLFSGHFWWQMGPLGERYNMDLKANLFQMVPRVRPEALLFLQYSARTPLLPHWSLCSQNWKPSPVYPMSLFGYITS